MSQDFDIERFLKTEEPINQYEGQLKRLVDSGKEVVCIEEAVRGAVRNLRERNGSSFVIYGEPQSGKTEMMICLTAKLLDEGYEFILHFSSVPTLIEQSQLVARNRLGHDAGLQGK